MTSSTEEDDLFASLGNSLMRDLLTDIDGLSNPNNDFNNNTTTDNALGMKMNDEDIMFNSIARLEKELDATTTTSSLNTAPPPGANATSIGPPGLLSSTSTTSGPPGLAIPSAGAMVVDHASLTTAATTTTPGAIPSTPTANSGNMNNANDSDAWDQAMSQFSALSLTEDFLKADSARKQVNTNGDASLEPEANGLVSHLFPTDKTSTTASNGAMAQMKKEDVIATTTEEYDIQQGPTLSLETTGKDLAGFFPGFQAPSKTNNSNITTTAAVPSTAVPPVTSQQPANAAPSPIKMPPHPMMPMMGPPPTIQGQAVPGMTSPPPASSTSASQQQPHPMHQQPPPPGVMSMGGMPMPPPHPMQQHSMMRQGPGPHPPMPPPPHMPGPGGFPGMPPPHMQIQHQQALMMQQHHHLQHQQQQQRLIQQQQQQQQNLARTELPKKTPKTSSKQEVLNQKDFPPLGADAPVTDETKTTADDEDESKKENDSDEETETERSTTTKAPRRSVLPRITFRNPSPNAPSIPATAIECTSMTPRDLCYVLHSMMRPILTFSSHLDAYNADYYRWSYEDRKSRNLLFLGGAAAAAVVGNNLPNPVWKETKVKAMEMEADFRESVEKRSSEWSKEKHILGKSVKVNVKRPRALLATNTLSTALDGKVKNGGDGDDSSTLGSAELETEEDKQRAHLWASRLASDRGHLAYLNLVELRRLLQSRPGDAMGGSEEIESRRGELLMDVEENVSKLHAAFGVKKTPSDDKVDLIEVDMTVLARTLSLPKGRMLLSRVVDEGILPHPSACNVLPSAIGVVFGLSLTAELNVAPPPGEDRLLRSLTGLVRTIQPSIDQQNLLKCVSNVIDMKAKLIEKKVSMKSVLTSKRTMMELLHAVLSRGAEVCIGEAQAEWKAKEEELLIMLAGN